MPDETRPRRRQPGSGRDRSGRPPPDRARDLSEPVRRVLRRLPEIERRVIELRMGLADGHPHDLADTARALGLSVPEARDIERRAFERIREVVPLDGLQRLLEG